MIAGIGTVGATLLALWDKINLIKIYVEGGIGNIKHDVLHEGLLGVEFDSHHQSSKKLYDFINIQLLLKSYFKGDFTKMVDFVLLDDNGRQLGFYSHPKKAKIDEEHCTTRENYKKKLAEWDKKLEDYDKEYDKIINELNQKKEHQKLTPDEEKSLQKHEDNKKHLQQAYRYYYDCLHLGPVYNGIFFRQQQLNAEDQTSEKKWALKPIVANGLFGIWYSFFAPAYWSSNSEPAGNFLQYFLEGKKDVLYAIITTEGGKSYREKIKFSNDAKQQLNNLFAEWNKVTDSVRMADNIMEPDLFAEWKKVADSVKFADNTIKPPR